MAGFSFSFRFLRDLQEWQNGASARDEEVLERLLAAIAANPRLPGRTHSYYDPNRPSFLFRVGPLVIHYRVTNDEVEFLNLFVR